MSLMRFDTVLSGPVASEPEPPIWLGSLDLEERKRIAENLRKMINELDKAFETIKREKVDDDGK